jgi:hypothetical protein
MSLAAVAAILAASMLRCGDGIVLLARDARAKNFLTVRTISRSDRACKLDGADGAEGVLQAFQVDKLLVLGHLPAIVCILAFSIPIARGLSRERPVQ